MATKQIPPEVSEDFRRLGKKNGSAGGRAPADRLSEEERKARAREAGSASAAACAAKKKAAKKATKNG